MLQGALRGAVIFMVALFFTECFFALKLILPYDFINGFSLKDTPVKRLGE